MSAKPRIERAALEVFVRDGVDAATTKAIAAQAGVSEGAIYRHWRSKDELAITRLLMPPDNYAVSGRVEFQGIELVSLPAAGMRATALS